MESRLGAKHLAALKVCARAQSSCPSRPFNTWDLPDGSNWVSFHRTLSGFLLRFPGLADFELSSDGDRVTCSPAPNVPNATTEHLYINQVLPLVLSKSGRSCFTEARSKLALTASHSWLDPVVANQRLPLLSRLTAIGF